MTIFYGKFSSHSLSVKVRCNDDRNSTMIILFCLKCAKAMLLHHRLIKGRER